MCDIWKDNKNLKQLTEQDVRGLLTALKQYGTQQVVMSGGEALLNGNFFKLCEILRQENINVTLLSTGLLLKKHTHQLLELVNEIIVSLDGNEEMHDRIRNIPGAYQKLKEGIQSLKEIKPDYKLTARTVIHRLNFRVWPDIIRCAHELGIDQISFLPADVSSQAFNRHTPWDEPRQGEILIAQRELPELKAKTDEIIKQYATDIQNGFIAESQDKLQKIYSYYAAFYGLNPFPYKKCNAPWVSTVIEADGNVRPCFFHKVIGNIQKNSLEDILNSKEAIEFRKTLDMDKDSTCAKCVCYLNLTPTTSVR